MPKTSPGQVAVSQQSWTLLCSSNIYKQTRKKKNASMEEL